MYHSCILIFLNIGPTGATAHSKAYFGEGSGPVHLNSVECSGMEYNLTDCKTMNSGLETSHSLDVGVKCQPGIYTVKSNKQTLFFLFILY